MPLPPGVLTSAARAVKVRYPSKISSTRSTYKWVKHFVTTGHESSAACVPLGLALVECSGNLYVQTTQLFIGGAPRCTLWDCDILITSKSKSSRTQGHYDAVFSEKISVSAKPDSSVHLQKISVFAIQEALEHPAHSRGVFGKQTPAQIRKTLFYNRVTGVNRETQTLQGQSQTTTREA